MKITAVHVSNVQKIKDVQFEPDQSGLFIIGGNNAQGKTSILRALAFLFGGCDMIPDNFVRDGADTFPYIRAEMSNGWIVERKGKNAELKITDPTGAKNGQRILDELLATHALNIGTFIEASDKEKAKTLLSIIGHEEELNEFDEEEKRLYEERTIVGREALRLKKAAEEMPVHLDVPESLLDPSELIAKQTEIVTRNAKVEMAKRKDENNKALRDSYIGSRVSLMQTKEGLAVRIGESRKSLENRIEDARRQQAVEVQSLTARIADGKVNLERRIEELRQQQANEERELNERIANSAKNLVTRIEELRQQQANEEKGINEQISATSDRIAEMDAKILDVENEIKAASGTVYQIESTAEIEEQIGNYENTNHKVRQNMERKKVLKEADDRQLEYDNYTAKVNDVRRRRKELLDAVNLPYPGLSVRNGVLEYNEKTWGAMSGSEQITVACSIISRLKPECEFLLIDKLEQKDEVQLAAIDDWAKEHGIQMIGTRVSVGSECNLIIEDGSVLAR